jgi:CRISPR-associated endonuclease Cas1
MAASSTLPQYESSRKPPINKTGVLTLIGFGIRIRMQSGHLEIEDGIGPERRKIRLARVGHGLKRLVCIGSDGFVSLAALRWLADQDAAFVMLDRDGSVLATTGPVRPSDARLRRAQALAGQSGVGLRIMRELIGKKLDGQAQVARDKLLDTSTAQIILRFREQLATADTPEAIRLLESRAGAAYWAAWRTLPINFPRNDLRRVPDHWRSFGARISPLTGSPRLAVNPANAILNYLYALLESEASLTASILGLDSGMGILHADRPNRESFACDLMEPVRPRVDAYVLDWITREFLKREWFFEQRDGNCRLMGPFAARLSETAPTWGRAVAPFAEWVARTLASGIPKPNRQIRPATRLTQGHRRLAKDTDPLPAFAAPRPDHVCRFCGTPIAAGKIYCVKCAPDYSRERLQELAKKGRIVAQSPEAQARRSATKRRHDLARSSWSASDLPAWLTAEIYQQKIQPRLAGITGRTIASALGVSDSYAADIRAGRRCPHPRHWEVLAELVSANRKLIR